jgi:hypothetical protein
MTPSQRERILAAWSALGAAIVDVLDGQDTHRSKKIAEPSKRLSKSEEKDAQEALARKGIIVGGE